MENLFAFIYQESLLITALLVLVVLFLRRESAASGEKLSPNQTVRAMNADEALVLDIRDKKEFSAGHISGAMHIPHTKVANSLSQLEKYREKRIIIADKLGQQAGSVGKLLAKEGFNAARLGGGMEEWRTQGMPVVK